MVTNGNPGMAVRQPHVTVALGNILFPPEPLTLPMPSSQPVRRTFDILKAEEKRRLAGGLSYAKIAAAMGLGARQTVGHWFRGRGEPDVQQMKAMAKVLGCHWLELVNEETVVVYLDDEVRRVERMRGLSDADVAELDAFLAFKASSKPK
ncbi:helix-turn-helix domain-containing protein [Lysobacter sp. F6437]|uniref:helix-turn-helix domain-containing protein n=1 Tax=Lysobacter sp. F6437 TaxID=3459296 RepID=UPI00403D8C59